MTRKLRVLAPLAVVIACIALAYVTEWLLRGWACREQPGREVPVIEVRRR